MLTKITVPCVLLPAHIYLYLLDNLVIGHLVAEHSKGVAKVWDQRRDVRRLIGVSGHSELPTQEIEKSNSCKHERRRGRRDGHVLVHDCKGCHGSCAYLSALGDQVEGRR
jgi:hypothetical protein